MVEVKDIGFVGLGVMGEPMCANLIRKSGRRVHVFDTSPEAVARVVAQGGIAEASVEALAGKVDTVFLSLPSIEQVEPVCAALTAAATRPRLIVDMSTSDVARSRALASRLAGLGVAYIDAPVARTREAAVQGTLLISVGGSESEVAAVKPLLDCMGSDVIRCGEVGCGQMVKILNNMVVFMSVNALSEVLTIGRRAGMDGEVLFKALAQGSADSFVLRNHGLKSLVPDTFPEKVFPTVYAIKDASLALALAKAADFRPRIAQYTYDTMCQARDAGFAQNYHPAVVRLVDGRVKIAGRAEV